MVKSSSYWKVVGATVAATAAAIWKMLTDAGVKEEDITNEQIQKLIEMFVPKDMNIPALGEDAEVIDVVAENTATTDKGDESKTEKEVSDNVLAENQVEEKNIEELKTDVEVTDNVTVEDRAENKEVVDDSKLKTIELAGGRQRTAKLSAEEHKEKVQKIKQMILGYTSPVCEK